MNRDNRAIAQVLLASLEKAGDSKAEQVIIDALVTTLKRTHTTERGPAIALEVERLFEQQHGIIRGTVVSAQALSESQKETLAATIQKQYHSKTVHLEYEIKEEVLGGFSLTIDDMRYDTTLQNKLVILNKTLTQ